MTACPFLSGNIAGLPQCSLLPPTAGEEENLLSGQSNTWFDMLTPDVQSKSTQITLGATTGAALLTQGGSQIAGDAPLFAALDPIMQVKLSDDSIAFLCLHLSPDSVGDIPKTLNLILLWLISQCCTAAGVD